MRLIDADALAKTIKETCMLAKPWDYVLIEQTIADAPTIDAVPVVRCRECKNFDTEGDGFGICKVYEIVLREAHFCSYGERSEDEDIKPKEPPKPTWSDEWTRQ